MENKQKLHSAKKRWPWLLLAASLLVIALVYLATADLRNIRHSVTLEAGEALSADLFFEDPENISPILTDLSSIDPTVPGTHTIPIQTRLRTVNATLTIRDTAAPTAQTVELETFVGDLPEAGAFVTDIEDVTNVTISYKQAPGVLTPGDAQGVVLLTDASGNKTELDVSLLVIADTAAPVISGVRDYTVFAGDALDVESSVTVSDDYDSAPVLSVDLGGLDLNAPGVYTITYTAVDFSGNTAVMTAAVTVIEDTAAPTISGVRNITIYKNETPDYISGVTVSDDYDTAPVLTIDDSEFDPETPGEYTVTYNAVDFSGNTVIAAARITVLDDTTPPVISGVTDHTVFIGDPIDYTTGVTAADERDAAPVLTIDDSALDLTTPGNYTIVYTAADDFGNVSTLVSHITVKLDTEPPVLSGVVDLDVFIGDPVDYVSGVTAFDERDGALAVTIDDSEVDLTRAQSCYVYYSVTDSSGNTATAKARIRPRYDTKAPTIEGAANISVELGGTVSYRKGVTVTDNRDAAPMLTIDNSEVNLNKEGRYKVIYTATDAAGNSRSVTVRVTVTRKQLDDDDVDIIWPMCDQILSSIITDDMSDMEKAFKIYGWCRSNIRYSGSSDKSHWVMGAYDAFTKRSGDCYNYYAAGKALLTRAGIANWDVIKNENQYSRHFWSLVDVGGGWYHFDSCPFAAGDDDFFMLTDAELDHWDRTHRGAHPFDKELYPERSTESVQHMLNYRKYEVKD